MKNSGAGELKVTWDSCLLQKYDTCVHVLEGEKTVVSQVHMYQMHWCMNNCSIWSMRCMEFNVVVLVIVRVCSVVLRRTVVGVDWCFDNLSGSHHQRVEFKSCQLNFFFKELKIISQVFVKRERQWRYFSVCNTTFGLFAQGPHSHILNTGGSEWFFWAYETRQDFLGSPKKNIGIFLGCRKRTKGRVII